MNLDRGIRIVFECEASRRSEEYEDVEFEVENFPSVPREGDLIYLDSFLSVEMESKLNDKQLSLFGLAFYVNYVAWGKDKKGIYVKLNLSGD